MQHGHKPIDNVNNIGDMKMGNNEIYNIVSHLLIKCRIQKKRSNLALVSMGVVAILLLVNLAQE